MSRRRTQALPPDQPAEPGEQLDLRGSFDSLEPDGRAFGWCWSPDEPDIRRPVRILVDGRDAAATIADILREDLLVAGIGDGGHGFVAEIPADRRPPGSAAAILLDAATGRRIGAELRVTWPEPEAGLPKLAGNVDLVTRDGWVSGWCWDPADPARRLELDVLIYGTVAGRVTAAEARADLRHASVGDGRYGFNFMLPYEALADRGTVQVRVVEHGTGRPLGEPALLRIGRRAESETRLQELEREVALMRGRLEEVARAADQQPEAEARTARSLFATVAGFFQDLADGLSPAAVAVGPRAGVATAIAELRRSLPPLELRSAAPGPDGRPLATLAVPASAPVEQVHSCLAALRASGADLLADIVLLDPSGHDANCALLPALVANLRVGPASGSAVASFARLLRDADTRLVGLIAPEVRPGTGWLEELAATLDAEHAGLVGSVVTRPDGLLHHAGYVLAADLRFRDLGHLALAALAEHRFLRPVNAVEPLALLADRARVEAAGGLDTGYGELAPATADLCLALQAAGSAVLRQPAALALWAASGPLDVAPRRESSATSEDGRRLRLAVLRHARDDRAGLFLGHALVVDAELPTPDRDAGSVVAVEQMQVLRRLGWHVTFAAATGAALDGADRRRLERAGIEVAQTGEYGVVETLRDAGADLRLVHLYRHRVAAMLLPHVRRLAPEARIVFSPADLHFLRESREADLDGRAPDPPAATRAQELDCVRKADATILLSDHEVRLLAPEVPPSKLHLLRWIARPAYAVPAFDARDGLLFIGNFRHAPNVDAVLWYAREILPIVERLRPGLVLDLVGADAPPPVLALEGAAIRVRGWTPDLAPLLARARLTVAPLRYGAGFKGKVATSLAAGVPVVGTASALEGTGLGDGDGVALADTPEAIARAIVRVHDEAASWSALSARARERVATLYSPDAADALFRGLLSGLRLPTR